MLAAGMTGDVLKRWRVARGWSTRGMAEALQRASEQPLPATESLKREVARWERGSHLPGEEILFAYHRVFPGIGTVEPPPGIAVFGGPGQPEDAARAALVAFDDIPGPAEVERIAAEKLAAGADPAHVWALREAYRDLRCKAGDTAALLAALTSEGGERDAAEAG